jgi:prophage maintenance system killer protein
VSRVKFTTQAYPSVLADVRAVASEEGRQFQAVVEEALRAFMDANLRTAVVAADIHLRLNGFLRDVNPSADTGFFHRVAQAGSKESERIEPWLRKHARKH